MKPNKLQKNISSLIEGQAKFWNDTNDINSPTHICDIETDVDELDIDEDRKSQLIDKLIDLLNFVRNASESN